MLPLTSLGEASMAPTVMVMPTGRIPILIPKIMGTVSAIPKRMALEKSVLLKYSESSLKAGPSIFFRNFKSYCLFEVAKILRPKAKFVNLFRNVRLLKNIVRCGNWLICFKFIKTEINLPHEQSYSAKKSPAGQAITERF